MGYKITNIWSIDLSILEANKYELTHSLSLSSSISLSLFFNLSLSLFLLTEDYA